MKRISRLPFLLSVCVILVSLCSSCSDSETSPTQEFYGYVWRLDTPLSLTDYFTYEPGKHIAFSRNGLGWVGVQKKAHYTVRFTYEVMRERPNSIEIYLHTSPDFYYYLAEIQVDGDQGRFLLFSSYEDFYQYHVHQDKSLGTWVYSTRVGRYN